MKRGGEYIVSPEKRRLDKALLMLTAPLLAAAGVVVKNYIHEAGITHHHILDQERIGRLKDPFLIHKFLTLHPETGQPFSPTAVRFRRLGLDELAQAQNIREGNMSFTGWRPLIPEDYERFRDALPPALGARHDFVLAHSLPGQLSSYGIHSRLMEADEPDNPEIRAEMDIKDFVDASVENDLFLAKNLVTHALARRLL